MASQTLANERYEIFKSQDLENGFFDLKFEVEGKPLYAHKFMLGSVSEVFKRMISETWNKKESIEISTNSYDDFYEFLTFLYSGECKINDENIFTLVDLSEFYNVKSLQQKCDEYLSQKKYTSENFTVFFEKLTDYFKSLPLFVKHILEGIRESRFDLVKSDDSNVVAPKETCENVYNDEERLFKTLYEWAENRATKKQKESSNENFNLNDAIKTEITPFLPNIEYKKMDFKFLLKFVVKRGYIFSSFDELSDILYKTSCVKVKVTNANRKSVSCMLPRDSKVVEDVKNLKNCSSAYCEERYVAWRTQFIIPSTPSQLKKRDDVEWYLIYLNSGQICLKHQTLLDSSHYLIAEMTSETSGFKCTPNCKIEIE